jgi:hypothetical protein
MAARSLGQLEEHAFYILSIAVVLMILWHGVWGVADEFFNYLHMRYGIKKIYLHFATIAGVILIIGIYPEILDKL